MLKIIASILTVVVGFVELMLISRFVLKLLAANEANALVGWVYAFTYPFISPFTGIFNLPLPTSGVVIEIPTILAIIVFGILSGIFGSVASSKSKS
jgi:YggT family protein